MKQEAIDIFKDGGLSLHKRHSNIPELEKEISLTLQIRHLQRKVWVQDIQK